MNLSREEAVGESFKDAQSDTPCEAALERDGRGLALRERGSYERIKVVPRLSSFGWSFFILWRN